MVDAMTMRADLEYRSIPRMALESARRFGDAPAVIDGDIVLSFNDVADVMQRVAASLIASGIEPRDRVALWAPNSSAWITTALGIMAAGAWLVPINTRFRGAEAADIINRAEVRTLFVTSDFLGTDYLSMLNAEASTPSSLTDVVKIPTPYEGDDADWRDFISRGRDVSQEQVHERLSMIGSEDISDIIFTSGTTGTPKGVMLRHGASLRCYESYNTGFCLGEGDRHLIATPFFHCFGYKAGWMLSLLVGAVTIPLPVFDARAAIEIIERHRVTHMPGAPTMYFAMLDEPERVEHDISSLKTAIIGAATIPEELVRRMLIELEIEHLMTGYGLTENHALGFFTRPDDLPSKILTTVGQLAPGLEARLVDQDGHEVGAGTPGEVEFAGYARMAGYYNDAVATDQAFDGDWLRTGDVGVLDAEGYLTITDRKKDIFVMGGFNVAPAEVEKVLVRLGGVSQVAVVAMPDDRFGEVGAAFVIPRPDTQLIEQDVIDFARLHLANYKVPRKVVIVEELPVNATGKVLKSELRRRLAEETKLRGG